MIVRMMGNHQRRRAREEEEEGKVVGEGEEVGVVGRVGGGERSETKRNETGGAAIVHTNYQSCMCFKWSGCLTSSLF